jgi:hypothetical protein
MDGTIPVTQEDFERSRLPQDLARRFLDGER